MIQDLTQAIYSNGSLVGNWTSTPQENVALGIAQALDPTTPYPKYHYVGTGCYSTHEWAWYFRTLHWYQAIPCVPLFAFLLALWNMQRIELRSDKVHALVMVILGCASFAGTCVYDICENNSQERKADRILANKVGAIFIHGSIGNILGAFAVSVLGSLYAQFYRGFAFVAMVPGVLLLVPVRVVSIFPNDRCINSHL